jgi:hypothetical protein
VALGRFFFRQLPDDHAIARHKYYRECTHVIHQFSDGKVTGMKNSRPQPCIQADLQIIDYLRSQCRSSLLTKQK